MFSEFLNITGFDVRDFIERASSFLLSRSQIIRSYYESKGNYPEDTFKELDSLVSDYNEFSRVVRINSGRFNSTVFWEILEVCEDLGSKLLVVSNYAKFLRSSRSPKFGGDAVLVQENLGQNESIETIAEKFNSDPMDVFLENSLTEEDYTKDGGNLLNFKLNRYRSVKVQSIVDQPIGDRVYGIDIDKDFSFKENDIKVLPPKETVKQSFGILLGLRKGQIPENKERGIDQNLITGSNSKSVMYPTIMRQLLDSVRTDDSFESVKIEEIRNVEDSSFIELSAKTIIGDDLENRLEL